MPIWRLRPRAACRRGCYREREPWLDLTTAEPYERLENSQSLAAVNRPRCQCDALAQRVRLAGNEQRRGSVQHHDIAERAFEAAKHGADMRGVLDSIAAGEAFGPGIRQSGIARRNPKGRDLAHVHHGNVADPGGGELVEPVAAMDHPGPLSSEQRKHLRDRLDPLLPEHADDLIFGTGRIGEGPEQIEDGARPEL